jgi:hypothetical protein
LSKDNTQYLTDAYNDITIEKFIKENNIQLDAEVTGAASESAKGFEGINIYNGPRAEMAKWYLYLIGMTRDRGVFYPCVESFMKTENPPHYIRMAFALFYFLKLGKTEAQVNEIFAACAETYSYLDRGNVQMRKDCIHSLINYDSFVSCDKLEDENCCLREHCARWRRWHK